MRDDALTEDIIELELTGTFKEMGEQYIAEAGDRILAQHKAMESEWFSILNPEAQIKFQQAINNILLQIKKPNQVFIPREIMDFLSGMAETQYANEHGLSLDDFLKMDLALFLSMLHPDFLKDPNGSFDHCSYVAITRNGKVGLGRNLDWPVFPLSVLNKFTTILHLKCTEPGYNNSVRVIGPAGSISAFTIANNKGLFWAHNSATTAMHMRGVMLFNRPYVAAEAVVRMFQVEDFNKLKNSILYTPCGYPSIINIAGPQDYEMASIECCPCDPKNLNDTNAYQNTLLSIDSKLAVKPKNNVEANGYVSTNLIYGDWEPFLGKKPAKNTPTFAKERSKALRDRIAQPSNVGLMKTITNYLSDLLAGESPAGATKKYPPKEPFEKDITTTHYSVVYIPSDNKLAVRLQKITNQNNSYEGQFTEWKKIRPRLI